MKLKKWGFFVLPILLTFVSLPNSGLSQTYSINAKSFTEQVVQQMALGYLLKNKHKDIIEAYKQFVKRVPSNGLSATGRKRLFQAFDNAYSEQRLLHIFKDSLQQKIAPQYRPKILAWLHKPLTQTLNHSRRQYYTLEGKRAQVVAMYQIDHQPTSDLRKQLINELTDMTANKPSPISSVSIMYHSTTHTIGQLFGGKGEKYFERVMNTIFKVNIYFSGLPPLLKRRRRFALMFHDVSIQNLRKYISFFKSKTGKQLSRAINQSRLDAFKNGAAYFRQAAKSIR